ncbi:hypothetical protein P3X46_002844 [Hevea brasiliensis]|uniref:Uncharacterized protein n=1 Tax=Hevea brasiliensis TaxID=3981 RepID=A0ABQ9N525_HEVBR|nr:hypothetical protein P3X46_002844 [Hevea brasiliensis]
MGLGRGNGRNVNVSDGNRRSNIVEKDVEEPGRSTSSLPALQVGENGISQRHESSKSRGSDNGFANQTITFPVPDFIRESNHEHVVSMMQSPPTQVMERSRGGGAGYDPLRIPSAIFETNKTTSPVDWSIASNDSLFSLQLGNSFSRERKPAEVELQVSPSLPVSVADTECRVAVADTDNPPSVPMEEIIEETTETKKAEEATGLANETTSKDATKPGDVEDTKERKKKTLAASCKSKNSDKSGESNHSFTFPVLAAGVKTTSPKGFAKSQPPQPPPTPQAIAKSACGNCFHCFSCHPCSCSSCHPCSCSSCCPSSCRPCSCSSCHPCSCSSCHPCSCSSCCPSSCRPCSCSSCHPCSCSSCCPSSCHPCSCSSCHPCSCSSCCPSSCHPCNCSSCNCSSCHPCSCSSCCPCSCYPCSCSSCNPSCCCSCRPSCSCSCRPSFCCSCNLRSCSDCHPCSCSNCHPCSCSFCDQPCSFSSSSCCPCLCSSCCPCSSCSIHPFSCISCPPFSFSSCDPRNCTSCHQQGSCASRFRDCCFCSCSRCCRCC